MITLGVNSMTKADKLLIVIVVLLSIASLGYLNSQGISDEEKYVSIQYNGEEIRKVIFDKQIVGTTIPIRTELGYNLIEIGDEKVRVAEADCPDQIDVEQGWISDIGETLICLPNRLVVEIKGQSSGDEVDIINY